MNVSVTEQPSEQDFELFTMEELENDAAVFDTVFLDMFDNEYKATPLQQKSIINMLRDDVIETPEYHFEETTHLAPSGKYLLFLSKPPISTEHNASGIQPEVKTEEVHTTGKNCLLFGCLDKENKQAFVSNFIDKEKSIDHLHDIIDTDPLIDCKSK